MSAYVNYRGEQIGLIAHPTVKKAKKENLEGSHNGWRVQGIPPMQLQEAREAHERLVRMAANSGGAEIKRWDEEHYLMNAKRKPVRGKPFEIPAAAQECKALAERAGWLRVEVVELKKEPARKSAPSLPVKEQA